MSFWPILNHKLFVPAVGALSIIGFCSGEGKREILAIRTGYHPDHHCFRASDAS